MSVRMATDWITQRRGVVISVVDTGTGIHERGRVKNLPAVFQHQIDEGNRPGPLDQQRNRAEV